MVNETALRRLANMVVALGLVVMMVAIVGAQTSEWTWIHAIGMVVAAVLAAVVVVQAWRLGKELEP